MSLKALYLFGYSGHALVVNDCVDKTEYALAGYFDMEENIENPLNLNYIGDESEVDINSIIGDGFVFPSIGSIQVRKRLVEKFETLGLNQLAVIHDSAYISNSAHVGVSSMIGPKAVVNAQATIGKGVIINTSALIEHECTIADYCHIAPGTVLAGNVTVGECTFVGANSTIKEGVTLGSNVIIGAGSVVLQNVSDNEMWAGIPARKIKDLD